MRCRPRRLALLLSSACLIQSHGLVVASGEPESAEARPVASLRARLTEREDEIRVPQPLTIDFLGYPLSATLQYELAFDWIRQITRDPPSRGKSQVLFEQEAKPELFFTLGPQLSFFAQARVGMERDFPSATQQRKSRSFVERGEMWLYSEPIPGSASLNLAVGRLDFEDDRRWWWDEDLDALRITVAGESFELSIAAGRELYPTRSDRRFVAPIAEASWDWRADHSIQLFALFHDDRSRTPGIGEFVSREREDAADAKLTWLGARVTGAWTSKSAGVVGYWVDTAWVRGSERALDLAAVSTTQSVVNERVDRDVRGWAFDVGATWIAPLAFEPRFTLGYARGSGDTNRHDGRDRAFRQTGLQTNAPGFGGVQSFPGYGQLLDPELSNLSVATASAGISLFNASSLDLVYHQYRQLVPTDSLRNARLNASLTGRDRDLGHGIDVVLAVEEWGQLHFELAASAFRTGAAFGTQRVHWAFGAFTALRLAF